MDKILNIYKPKGITSHDLVDLVRKEYPNEKVGHAGALDPHAEGVMLIGVGKATKRLKDYVGLDKEYVAEVVFGLSSQTDDLDSKNVKTVKLPNISQKQLSKALIKFRGEIEQRVPLYSATHLDGEKLYKRARKGEKIPFSKLPSKKVNILHLEAVSFSEAGFEHEEKQFPVVELDITCTSGTYIRSLARDLGRELGTSAILTSLVRTQIGDYSIKKSRKIDA